MSEATPPPEPFEIDVEILPEDLKRALLFFQAHQPWRHRYAIGWPHLLFVSPFVALFLLDLLVWQDYGPIFAVKWLLLPALGVSLFLICARLLVSRAINKIVAEAVKDGALGRTHLLFSPERILESGESGETLVRQWSPSELVDATADHIFVHSDLGVEILPRRAFTTDKAYADCAPQLRRIHTAAADLTVPTAIRPVAESGEMLEFSMTVADVDAGFNQIASRPRWYSGPLAASPCASIALVLQIVSNGGFKPEHAVNALLLLLLSSPIMWGFIRVGTSADHRRLRKRLRHLVGLYQLWSATDGLRVVSSAIDHRRAWGQVKAITEDSEYCKLQFSKYDLFLIPARAFPGRDEFTAYVAQMRAYRDAALASA